MASLTDPPVLERVGERVYDILEPLAHEDYYADWSLNYYCGALGSNYQEMAELVEDGPNGEPGWSIIVDLERIPDKGLDWLAQFVGEVFPEGISPADKRDRLRHATGWDRGTVAAIRAAARPWLTGTKTVIIEERDTSAYHFTVKTYRPETPSLDWAVDNLISNPSFEVNTNGWSSG
jgi:hypothetical protein